MTLFKCKGKNKEFYILDYITSESNAYIETGYSMDVSTIDADSFYFTFAINAVPTKNQYFLGYSSSYLLLNTSGVLKYQYLNNSFTLISATEWSDNPSAYINKKMTLNKIGKEIFFNDTSAGNVSYTSTTLHPQDIFFAAGSPYYSSGYANQLKFFSYQAYRGDTLVKDLIPVQRISDGAVGVYDKYLKTFIGSADSNYTFTAGNIIGYL